MATYDCRTLDGAHVRVITTDSVEVAGHLVFELPKVTTFRVPRARLLGDLLSSAVRQRARRVSRIARTAVLS